MKLIAWRVGTRWSSYHIRRFDGALCGTPVPQGVQRFTERPARTADWLSICEKCREAALQRISADLGESPDQMPPEATAAAGPADTVPIGRRWSL